MDCYTGFIANLKNQILQHTQLNHTQMVLCPLSVWNSIRYCITSLVKEFPNVMCHYLCVTCWSVSVLEEEWKRVWTFSLKKKNLFYSFTTRRKSFRLFLGWKSAEIVQSVNINNPFKLYRKLQKVPKHQTRQIIHIKFWSALLQSDLHFKVRIQHSKVNL